jgi:uncharacterized protein YdhG (YjbR/CyaY superfamily)
MWQCPKCERKFKNTNQDHYCGDIETIDQYIFEQSEEVQPILHKLREVIRRAAPDATEKMSWQMPTFWQGENLIHFAAFKKHISIFPGAEATTLFANRLTEYKISKGTIQLPLYKPLPYELIADITQWRVSCAMRKNNQDMDTSKMTHIIHDIPDYVAVSLDESGLWERYRARPPYQRNDYIGWITRGKREETRRKRLNQMLDELHSGNAYMGMEYNAK